MPAISKTTHLTDGVFQVARVAAMCQQAGRVIWRAMNADVDDDRMLRYSTIETTELEQRQRQILSAGF
jgi:hypothetical protein